MVNEDLQAFAATVKRLVKGKGKDLEWKIAISSAWLLIKQEKQRKGLKGPGFDTLDDFKKRLGDAAREGLLDSSAAKWSAPSRRTPWKGPGCSLAGMSVT